MTTSVSVSFVRRMAAEFVGTFAMVFAGCGAIVVNTLSNGAIGHSGIATAFGLAVMVMIYSTGHISGAHFNPAVSIAFAVARRFSWREVPGYILSQCVAALTACALLRLLFPEITDFGTTTPSGSVMQSLAMEVVLTFFLMFVITSVATDSRAVGQMAGLAIGATVSLCALFGGPISGASMNPARTLAPGLISGQFSDMWIYFVGPVLGAVFGALIYQTICCAKEEQPSCC